MSGKIICDLSDIQVKRKGLGEARVENVKNKLKAPKTDALHMIALGANVSLHDCTLQQTLAHAVQAMTQKGFLIRAVSRFFQTPCFPEGAGPDYVNAAVCVQSPWGAVDTLRHLHEIEADFGRERVQRWGQRTLDLDLIAIDDLVLPDAQGFQKWYALDPAMQAEAAPDGLVLPHPRLQDRAFVLVPLVDIAPDWHHPVLHCSVRELLGKLPVDAVAGVKPI